MSTLSTLIQEGYDELNEDIYGPLFWPLRIVRKYIYQGLRDITAETHFNLTERSIPLYSQVESVDEEGTPTFESFSGIYAPPLRQIQTMTAIFWKSNGRLNKLKVLYPDEMDKLDPDWQTKTADRPTHAVLWSGNYNDMNMQTDPRRNGIKIKLYPTPSDLDPELQTALYQLQGKTNTLEGYSVSAWSSLWGGLATATAEGIVWGLDDDGDGQRDDTPVPESSSTGILVDIINGTYDLSDYDGYPVIRYVPDYDRDFFNTIDGNEWDLDDFLPETLQQALVDYMCHRCFDKEGEARDKKQSDKYKERYEEGVSKYVVRNELYDVDRVAPDSNFNFGAINNMQEGESYTNIHNPLNM